MLMSPTAADVDQTWEWAHVYNERGYFPDLYRYATNSQIMRELALQYEE